MNPTSVVWVRLPQADLHALQAKAEEQDRTVAYLIREAVRRYLAAEALLAEAATPTTRKGTR